MIFKETKLSGAFIIKNEPISDSRGKFMRLFCKEEFTEIGFKKDIVQINYSINSKKGSVRGMHFQIPPYTETKIIKCTRGKVFDVIVDLRADSNTFLNWYGEVISSENGKIMFVPDGFAHGFQTLEDNSELLYLHTNYYNKNYESGLNYNDPLLKIKWPIKVTNISDKDKKYSFIDKSFSGIKL